MTPLHPTNLIAVPVPWYSEKYKISGTNYLCYFEQTVWQAIPPRLEQGKYSILGTVTADTIDFDVADFVGEEVMTIHKQTLLKYPDSEYKKESFRSLLTANDALFENPYGEHKPLTKKYLIEAWQTAQSKVNNKYVILEKK